MAGDEHLTPLRFRTAASPQYGSKASLSARACPGRDEVKPTPGMPPSPSEFTPRLRARNGNSLGTQPVRPEPGNPARSVPWTTPLTPGVLSSGRVMLSRPSSPKRPHAPVSGAPGDFTVVAAYTPGPRWAGAPEATPETFPTFPAVLSARAVAPTPVGSPPPPVVFRRRCQAPADCDRVAPHSSPRLCQQSPTGTRFRRCSDRFMLRPARLPGPPGWLRRGESPRPLRTVSPPLWAPSVAGRRWGSG